MLFADSPPAPLFCEERGELSRAASPSLGTREGLGVSQFKE